MANFRLGISTGARRGMTDRALERIEEKAAARAYRIARFIVEQIHTLAPYDDRASSDTTGPHLKDAYWVEEDPAVRGGMIIKCSRRYWAFVEFGTHKHGDAQPHVRPAIDAAKARFG